MDKGVAICNSITAIGKPAQESKTLEKLDGSQYWRGSPMPKNQKNRSRGFFGLLGFLHALPSPHGIILKTMIDHTFRFVKVSAVKHHRMGQC